MDILIDLATMAVMLPSGVPLTDLSLVRGDKLPLRVSLLDDGTPVTPSGTRPALAVKTALGDDTLVLAAPNLEPVDDALGAAYVGSLSVNTTQLVAAMGSAESIDLVGELVLMAGDGSQRTSSLIRVAVRQDIMPADVVPPEDVVANWEEMVAASLAAQLPDVLDGALQERGMHVDPVTGSSTLTTGEAETPTVMACYAMEWGDELLAGHLTDQCRLRSVTMTYYTDTGLLDHHWLRIWRLESDKYVVAGVAPAVALPANNQPMTWDFTPGVPLRRGDKIMLEICAGPDADHLTTHELGVHAVITAAKDGRGIASAVSYPPVITQATIAPVLSVTVDYDDGVMVGGTELATAAQMQGLGNDVRTASADAQAAATAATTARNQAQTAATNAGTSATSAASSATAAQQALAAIPQVDAEGNMTLAGGIALSAGQKITLSNGGATIYASSNSAVVHVSALASSGEISGNVVNCNRVAASTLSITTAATFGGTINANGGINIPVAPSTDTEAARYREVRLLHEMEFSALRTYFNSSNPFSWGILVDRFWWAAGRDNMPAWTVVTADFNMINLDNNNSAYDGLTSCYFPMSCGLGYGRCFDSIAIGNTSFNADYASLDDDPFATPAGYMRYWVDIQIGRPANGQCAVSVRMSRWDNASSTAVNTTHQCSVPDSLALRGVALSMTSKHSGVWLVGFDKSAGRLVSYKVLSETFTLDSYNRAMSSRLSLAKTAGHCSVGVHAPNYYGGTVLGEWCDLIQIN